MFERMRRGWELTKKSWGVIRSHPKLTKLPLEGGALALIAALGVALVASGNGAGSASGVVVFLLGLILAVAGLVFSGAVRGVFGVALYRWVADDQAIGPFTAQDLDSAARVR